MSSKMKACEHQDFGPKYVIETMLYIIACQDCGKSQKRIEREKKEMDFYNKIISQREYFILKNAHVNGIYDINPYANYGQSYNYYAVLDLAKRKLLYFIEKRGSHCFYKITEKGIDRLYSFYKKRYLRDQQWYLENCQSKLDKYQAYKQKDSTVTAIISGFLKNIDKTKNEIELINSFNSSK